MGSSRTSRLPSPRRRSLPRARNTPRQSFLRHRRDRALRRSLRLARPRRRSRRHRPTARRSRRRPRQPPRSLTTAPTPERLLHEPVHPSRPPLRTKAPGVERPPKGLRSRADRLRSTNSRRPARQVIRRDLAAAQEVGTEPHPRPARRAKEELRPATRELRQGMPRPCLALRQQSLATLATQPRPVRTIRPGSHVPAPRTTPGRTATAAGRRRL